MEIKIQSKIHKGISVIAISLISFFGLEALVYIRNLYDPDVYGQTNVYAIASGIVYLFLVIWLHFIFDLHFKDREHLSAKSLGHSLWRRFKHFMVWEHFRYFQNFMILPGLLFWGSVVLIGINFGHFKLQQFIAVVTSVALVISYSLFKEVFHQKDLPVEDNHFVLLTYIKVYASWLVYAGAFGIVVYYGFKPAVFYVTVFLVTMMLLYQALFQFCRITLQNIGFAVLISCALTLIAVLVYHNWNVNYFSAGLFMTAFYNYLWGMLYHTIKKNLTWRRFYEQTALFFLIVVMVFGVTDFKARIDS